MKISNMKDQNNQCRGNKAYRKKHFKNKSSIISLERSMRNEKTLHHERRTRCNKKGTIKELLAIKIQFKNLSREPDFMSLLCADMYFTSYSIFSDSSIKTKCLEFRGIS